jgi:hypothetical protein
MHSSSSPRPVLPCPCPPPRPVLPHPSPPPPPARSFPVRPLSRWSIILTGMRNLRKTKTKRGRKCSACHKTGLVVRAREWEREKRRKQERRARRKHFHCKKTAQTACHKTGLVVRVREREREKRQLDSIIWILFTLVTDGGMNRLTELIYKIANYFVTNYVLMRFLVVF